MVCKVSNLYRGDTKDITITITDNDGNAVDITGDSVILTVKENLDDVTPLYTDTNTTHTDPTNGITDFSIPKTSTDDFPITEVWLSVTWVRDSLAGQTYTLVQASMLVLEPVRDPV